MTSRVVCLLLIGWLSLAGSGRAPAWGQTEATGKMTGAVIDRATGDAIIEAGVEAVGTGKKTRTDLDGRWTLEVSPGRYEIRIYAPLYQSVRLRGISVTAGEVTKGVDATLVSEGAAAVEVVEVVAEASRAAEATQLVKRKEAAVVTDNVSAETMKKTPGSAASDVVSRAPAVTVRENRFVFVRGLGERYTSAVLNGSRLPSTDPQKRVIPLDLFPASFLDSLSVTKSYSPDLPGDFSGGLLDLQLREFPEELAASLSVSTGANTQATFRDVQSYRGSGTDFLTYGTSFRRIPKLVPENGKDLDSDNPRLIRGGRAFHNIWAGRHGPGDTDTAPPDLGLSATIGNSWGPFGVQLGGTWKNEYKFVTERQRQFTNAGTAENPQIIQRDDFVFERSTMEARLGGLLTAAYKPSLNHKVSFRALLNRNAENEVIDGSGNSFDDPEVTQEQTRIRWTEEELAFGQLAGEHRFDWFWLDWRSAFSRTTQDEPDVRHLSYRRPPTGGPGRFSEDSLGGLRLFNSLREILTDSGLDLTFPFRTGLPATDVWSGLPAKLKFGAAYSFRDRDFEQRRFQFEVLDGLVDTSQPAEDLLDPSRFGPGGSVVFREETQRREQFSATHEIIGGYGMIDLPIVRKRLRFVGGVRVEYSYIELVTFDAADDKAVVRKNTLDPLPAANLIYSPRDDMNVRAGWSRTVSRPEFRELSPTQFPAPRGLRPLFGDPDLVQSDIQSWDLRWEWFFSPIELVSLSFFQKTIDRPIEQVVIVAGANSADSFANSDQAELMGFEFEGRKHFGFVNRHLEKLSFLTNVTYAESTVMTTRSGQQVQTSVERPLQGQPRWIVNGILDWTDPDWFTARLLYTTADRVITNAGSFGLPDIFEERTNNLDALLIVPLERFLGSNVSMKLAAENILNDPVEQTQGGLIQRRSASGVKLGFSLTYAY